MNSIIQEYKNMRPAPSLAGLPQPFILILSTALGLLTLLCTFFTNAVHAQEAWPNHSITMVVPFPPGGVADTVARPVAEALSRNLGQVVIIENKVGAGGGVGMAAVAKS